MPALLLIALLLGAGFANNVDLSNVTDIDSFVESLETAADKAQPVDYSKLNQ